MRSSWIVVCALAVVGAFFVLLQLLWLFHVEPTWLPYVVHVAGAALAGAAMAKAAPVRSFREPLAGGVLAILVLAAVTFVLPKAFVLTAARADPSWLILPAIVAASGIACAGGAWLAAHSGAALRGVWIGAVAVMAAACAIQLGSRLGYVLGVPVSTAAVTLEMGILAFFAALATQAVVADQAAAAITAGVAAFMALGVVDQLAKHVPFDASWIPMLVPIVTAAFGARVAWQVKPSAVSS